MSRFRQIKGHDLTMTGHNLFGARGVSSDVLLSKCIVTLDIDYDTMYVHA